MADFWISLDSIPADGQSLIVDDPAVWEAPIAEFGMCCRVTEPLRGEVFLLPVEGGCLIRGRLTGKVVVPCDRCAEDVPVEVNTRFESFEPVPSEADSEASASFSEAVDAEAARLGAAGPEINPAALLWQEFALALPAKPLCSAECRGLCPRCGRNRNTGTCICPPEEGDPRMAALRNLKIAKR